MNECNMDSFGKDMAVPGVYDRIGVGLYLFPLRCKHVC